MRPRSLKLVVAAILGFGAGTVAYLAMYLMLDAHLRAGAATAVRGLAQVICPPMILLRHAPDWVFLIVPSLNALLYVGVVWILMLAWPRRPEARPEDEDVEKVA